MFGPEITRRLPVYENLKLTLYQGTFAGGVLALSFLHNFGTRRPFNALMLKHVAAAALGYYLGCQVDKLIEDRRNLRVNVIEDYIARHPEDFPVQEPKKYKDILLQWYPIR